MTQAAQFLLLSAITLVSVGCCGPMWQAGGCGPACGVSSCGTAACGSCDDGCGECGGCGELYIDPWINHPADCCDPCDSCGNFNGQSCGKCRGVFAGVKSLWGYKCDDGSCGSGGCDSGSCGGDCSHGGCDSGGCGCGSSHSGGHEYIEGDIHSYGGYSGGEYSDGEIISEEIIGSGSNPRITTQPRIARQPGQKQIFQPRRVNGPKKPLAY